MTDIYLHIDARMADYIRTHPYNDDDDDDDEQEEEEARTCR